MCIRFFHLFHVCVKLLYQFFVFVFFFGFSSNDMYKLYISFGHFGFCHIEKFVKPKTPNNNNRNENSDILTSINNFFFLSKKLKSNRLCVSYEV